MPRQSLSVPFALAPSVALLFLSCSSEATLHTPPPPLIELQEEAYYQLPSGFRPSGVAAHPDGRLLVWSLRDVRALLLVGDLWVTLQLEAAAVGARFLPDGGVEVVDAAGRHHRFDPDGVSGPPHMPPATDGRSDSVVGASYVSGQWYVLSQAGTLFRVRDSEPPDQVRASWPELPGAVASNIVLGRAGENSLLLTATVYPFAALRYNVRTGELMSFETVNELSIPSELQDGQGLWRSLGMLPLAQGYLRTLSDARSDNRLMVLYDSCGRSIRATALRAPLGFAAATDQHVLAVRHAGETEVVRYGWELNEATLRADC